MVKVEIDVDEDLLRIVRMVSKETGTPLDDSFNLYVSCGIDFLMGVDNSKYKGGE